MLSSSCTQRFPPNTVQQYKIRQCRAGWTQRAESSRHCRGGVAGASTGGHGSSGGANQSGDGPPEVSFAEQAAATVEQCMQLFKAGNLDELVDLLPDEVLDRAIQRKRAKMEGDGAAGAADAVSCSFVELVDGARPSDLSLDSYALRTLVLARPAAAVPLSSLQLGPEAFRQRYAVTGTSGEQAVLTVDLTLQDAVMPQYRGLRLDKKWFLRAISGEPAVLDPPTAPAPEHGPESVVQAQLAALQARDAAGVFVFASPANQAATGPVERFSLMLQSWPYAALLGHANAEVLRSVQIRADKALVIVGVTSGEPSMGQMLSWSQQQDLGAPSQQKLVFAWELGLQHEEGPLRHCWMTEGVRPLSGDVLRLFA